MQLGSQVIKLELFQIFRGFQRSNLSRYPHNYMFSRSQIHILVENIILHSIPHSDWPWIGLSVYIWSMSQDASHKAGSATGWLGSKAKNAAIVAAAKAGRIDDKYLHVGNKARILQL